MVNGKLQMDLVWVSNSVSTSKKINLVIRLKANREFWFLICFFVLLVCVIIHKAKGEYHDQDKFVFRSNGTDAGCW